MASDQPGPPAAQVTAPLVVLASAPGGGRVTVQLHPADLGRIELQLERNRTGIVQVTLTAERPDTLHALSLDRGHIDAALARAGLSPDQCRVTFALADGGKAAAAEPSGQPGPTAAVQDSARQGAPATTQGIGPGTAQPVGQPADQAATQMGAQPAPHPHAPDAAPAGAAMPGAGFGGSGGQPGGGQGGQSHGQSHGQGHGQGSAGGGPRGAWRDTPGQLAGQSPDPTPSRAGLRGIDITA